MDIIYILIFTILSILFFSYNFDIYNVNIDNMNIDNVEKFENFENINDKVYANFYNIIFNEDKLYKNDINNIVKHIAPKNGDIKILDAGCGPGRHYKYMNDKYPTIGVDISSELIKHAKIRNPQGKFVNDNLINDKIFGPSEFSVVICLLDSLYHNSLENIDKIVKNFYYWLKDDGYMCIHIFNRDKLDPGAREFTQYYKDNIGVKQGLTYFNKFTHDAYWKPMDKECVEYIETIVLADGRKKISNTKLYIPKDNNEIISRVEKNGFKLFKIVSVDHENDMEIYIFKKIKYDTQIIKL